MANPASLQVARLQRQLDMITEKGGAGGDKENLPSNTSGVLRARYV
jgi:hypothetical protein